MGNCSFCGREAGIFRGKHKECEAANIAGWREMVELAAQAVNVGSDVDVTALHASLGAIAWRSFVEKQGISSAIAQGWRETVYASLENGILTQEQEAGLRALCDRLALAVYDTDVDPLSRLEEGDQDFAVESARRLSQTDWFLGLDMEGQTHALHETLGPLMDGVDYDAFANYNALAQLDKAAVIRGVIEGTIPNRFKDGDDLPINLQKSEKLVWVFNGVDYCELKTRRERRGGSHGVSIRIARGLYYSPRQFRSQTHEWDETVHVGTGLLAITSKHIYFHGGTKSFRIPYSKIVSFEQFSDGFGVMRDTQTAKPQSFRTGDGWFVYNLVTNLAKL